MIEEQVKEIIAKEFELGVSEIGSDFSQQNHPKWDSLKHLNLVVAIEQLYEIEFEPEEISIMYNLNSIVELVKKKLNKE